MSDENDIKPDSCRRIRALASKFRYHSAISSNRFHRKLFQEHVTIVGEKKKTIPSATNTNYLPASKIL